MRIICPKAKYTKDKIECTATEKICVYQRYRQCKGQYWHTEGALNCRARSDEWRNENGK